MNSTEETESFPRVPINFPWEVDNFLKEVSNFPSNLIRFPRKPDKIALFLVRSFDMPTIFYIND